MNATVKFLENFDLKRIRVSLSEMLCYKCTQQCFNSVKFKQHIQKNINIHGPWSHEDHDQDVYGAFEKNMNLKEQYKQKLGKYIGKKAETNNMKQCRASEEN